ncbi:MAG: TIGR04086 family membrane protein [Oscillospiraceae bacterium]|nr:TIGR04086 family membrane protein [Oscillospiraceae bacterium]
MQKNDDFSKKQKTSLLPFFIHSTTGISVSVLAALICSLLISTETIPAHMLAPASYVVVIAGFFVAGLLSSLKYGKPLITSLLQALFSLVVFYILGALIYGRVFPETFLWQVPVFSLCGAVAGGIFSAFFSKRKR